MGAMSRIRLLVRHGEHLVDAGLAATLARQPDCELVAPAPLPPDDLLPAWLAERGVDIVVTDYERGLRLAERLQRAPAPRPRTMIVTGRSTQAEVRAALRHGVGGYLGADSSGDEVVDAVRKLHRGVRHLSAPIAQRLLDGLLGEALTPRETEVLRLAAQGLANKVIAARLKVELGTVKCHMKAVMDKLQAGNRTEAVVVASQRGLLDLHHARPGADLPPAPAPWAPAAAGLRLATAGV
ncbi:response regulator transcription factor [Rubrivivax gelatinosus]|nr:response regulator transcription factor [Rubrivivax gelatinosus]